MTVGAELTVPRAQLVIIPPVMCQTGMPGKMRGRDRRSRSLTGTNGRHGAPRLGTMVAYLKRNCVIFGLASLLLCGFAGAASSQTIAPPGGGTTALPAIEVTAPRRAQPPRRPRGPVITE